MGYVSCHMPPEVFAFYQPAVRAQLIKDFGIDLTTNSEVCDWLDEMERNQTPSAEAAENELLFQHERKSKLDIAETLRLTMQHYLMADEESRARCILESNLSTPTFVQFFEFALSQQGNPRIESWSKLARKMPKRERPSSVGPRCPPRQEMCKVDLVREDLGNGQVGYYEGPRDKRRLVRLEANNAVYYYAGPRDEERLVRIVAVAGKVVEHYEGPPGEESRVRIVKLADKRIEHYQGPRGEERKVRVASLVDKTIEYYEGRQGEERMVRVEFPNGNVQYFEGPEGSKKANVKRLGTPDDDFLPLVEEMD